MELTIEQSCPSCGASIVLSEDDKLIVCEFCDVSNFRVERSALRYTLPFTLPEDIHENDLFFVPYLRFKGVVYFVERESVGHKIVDTTRVGVEASFLPPSLGLRPQVMRVWPVTSAMSGTFFTQTIPVKSAFFQATKLVDMFARHTNTPVVHRAFIGETISVIYQPYYVKDDTLIDGVDKRAVSAVDPIDLKRLKTTKSKRAWEPVFIGTNCKKCGGIMQGERDSRVLVCENCSTHWLENKGLLKPLIWSVVEAANRDSVYFPFWKISFSATGVELSNFNSLINFTNQPIIVRSKKNNERLYFLLPGFKLNPKMYLQIASQLTMAQNKLPESSETRPVASHTINLELSEAVQSIKSVLAHLTVGKKKRLHNLPQITIQVERAELLYLPFNKKVHDYIQIHTGASIQVAAVRYGRSL